MKQTDIMIFVHGTFAQEAQWINNNSKIYQHFKNNFEIQKFKWSGGNSHIARHIASKKLYAFIKNLMDENKDYKFYIISHSHGGNIALKCLRYFGENIENIQSIICLGTPFISISPKEFPVSLNILSLLLGFITYLLIAFVLFYAMYFFNIDKTTYIGGILSLLTIVLALFSYQKVFKFIQLKINNIWDKVCLVFMSFYTMPLKKKINIFCAYTKNDEAYHLLNITENISSYLQGKYNQHKEKFQIIIFLISLISLISITMKDMNFSQSSWVLDLMVKCFVSILISSFMTLIIYHFIAYLLRLINYVFSFIFTSHRASFGIDNILGIIFVRISVSRHPNNNNFNLSLHEYEFKKNECIGLNHSCFYDNEKVINDIEIYLKANKTLDDE